MHPRSCPPIPHPPTPGAHQMPSNRVSREFSNSEAREPANSRIRLPLGGVCIRGFADLAGSLGIPEPGAGTEPEHRGEVKRVSPAGEGFLDDPVVAELGGGDRQAAEQPGHRPVVLMFRGDVLIRLGAEASEIEAAYREAMECARAQNQKLDQLQSTKRLARCLIGQGRAAEARTLLADTYNSFTEGFDTLLLREAKALLEEIDRRNY